MLEWIDNLTHRFGLHFPPFSWICNAYDRDLWKIKVEDDKRV